MTLFSESYLLCYYFTLSLFVSQVLYTRYDTLALERVVGTVRSPRLLEEGPGVKSTFVFV